MENLEEQMDGTSLFEALRGNSVRYRYRVAILSMMMLPMKHEG